MSSPRGSFVGLLFVLAHRDKQQGGMEAELRSRVDVWYVGALWLDTQDSKQKQEEKDLYITMLLCKKTFTVTYRFHQGLHGLIQIFL